VPPTLLRPSTNGSSIKPRNWLVIWKATCWLPVAASPESAVSALARLLPVSPKIAAKLGGSAPPRLKKPSSALATFLWLMLRPVVPIKPRLPVRLRITSLAV
jgi:hypothetical protein